MLDKTWKGQGGSAVLGPEDLSFTDMAAIMSDVLGKTVRFQQVPGEAYKAQLIQCGANEVFAQGIAGMLIPRTTVWTTPNRAPLRIRLRPASATGDRKY